MKKLILPILIAAILLVSAAYYISTKQSRTANSRKVSVIVSFYPLQEWAQRIGGDLVEVKNMTPVGLEPHDFEPSPKDISQISDADVFIYNGAGLEPWTNKITGQLNNIVVDASSGIDLLKTNNTGTPFDPHIWLDPLLAKQQAESIANAIIQADPSNKALYTTRLEILESDLGKLDNEFSVLNSCPKKTFITSHSAFHYLASRYGLEMITITGLSPEEEPSPKKLAEISRLAKENDVQYIFFETLTENKFAETIVREINGHSLILNPIEGLTKQELQEGKNYFSIQRENLTNLRIALQCNQ